MYSNSPCQGQATPSFPNPDRGVPSYRSNSITAFGVPASISPTECDGER